MTVPAEALYKGLLAPGVALWDVSHLLPLGDKKQRYRDVQGIDTLVVHHSGRLGRSGFAGLLSSARYMSKVRGFPSAGYTFWIPAETERDEVGNIVVYRCSPDNERDWHSGSKLNDRGVAVALQGNTSTQPLTFSHMEGLEALIPWSWERYGLAMPDGLCWHSDAKRRGGRSKKACPGKNAEAWLKTYFNASSFAL